MGQARGGERGLGEFAQQNRPGLLEVGYDSGVFGWNKVLENIFPSGFMKIIRATIRGDCSSRINNLE